MREWGYTESDLLSDDELMAVEMLRYSLGFDALAQPLFWERMIARTLGGDVTAHRALHDVEVNIWGRDCRAEVKFSHAFKSVFVPIRGENWTRHVFKWARPRGGSGKNTADAIILVGRDIDGLLFCWVVPLAAVSPTCASITMTAPSERKGAPSYAWDNWSVPWDAMLPAFARICHNTYDMPMRRAGIKERARKAMGVKDMFE